MKFASFAVALIASAIPTALASAINRRSEGTIPALLRGGSVQRRTELMARQAGSCDVGYLACSDGEGCCPVGEYCGTWGGKPGCCPNGESCVANNNPCIYVGDVLCSGETFCCPAGDTCSRDGVGNPQCSTTGGGNTLGPNTNTIVNTKTIVKTNTGANTPSATFVASTTKAPLATTVLSGGDSTTTTSKSGGGLTNPFSSSNSGNGAAANSVSGFLLVAAGVAANILLAAH